MKMGKMSSRDIGLLVFLVIMLLGVLYYMGFYKPMQQELASLATQTATVDDEINLAMSKAAKMKQMQEEVDEILARPKSEITEIAPYDNKEVVLNMLNGILGRTLEYSLSFTDPEVQEDGTVRRNISMNFSCQNYEEAKAVIRDLTKSNWRCLVSNCSIVDNGPYVDEDEIVEVDVDTDDSLDEGENIMVNAVTVDATITFFESTKLHK